MGDSKDADNDEDPSGDSDGETAEAGHHAHIASAGRTSASTSKVSALGKILPVETDASEVCV